MLRVKVSFEGNVKGLTERMVESAKDGLDDWAKARLREFHSNRGEIWRYRTGAMTRGVRYDEETNVFTDVMPYAGIYQDEFVDILERRSGSIEDEIVGEIKDSMKDLALYG